MRRVVIQKAGPPSVLAVIHEDPPIPRSGQVRIRVVSAGVAFGDVMRRRGLFASPHPFTPGYDVAGVVDALGPGSSATVGSRVAALMPRMGVGGYAEYVCVRDEDLVEVPSAMSLDTAVGLGLNYITAYQLLHRMVTLGPGARILVHGAAGGAGTALLDLARLARVTAYGTASAAKHDVVRQRGGIPIDYRTQDFVEELRKREPSGIDAVFDPIGADNLRRSYEVLNQRGTLVFYGISADASRGLRGALGAAVEIAKLKARFDRKRLRVYLISVPPNGRDRCMRDWNTVLALALTHAITPLIGATFELDQAAAAHEMLEAGSVAGKILLRCGAEGS